MVWNKVIPQNINTNIYNYKKISTKTAIFTFTKHEKSYSDSCLDFFIYFFQF